ncbi:hypothetical protein Tco_1363457 [Tanacetum coccineum]
MTKLRSSDVPVTLLDEPHYVALGGTDFEASKPSGTRTVSSHSLVSSDSIAPLSPDHPLTHVSPTPTPTRVLFHRRTARKAVRTKPTLSPGMSAHIAEADALSPYSFRDELGDEDTKDDESLDADDERERSDDEGHGLGDDDHGLDDESQGLEDERLSLEKDEAVPEAEEEDQVPSTFKVGQSSRSMLEQQGAERVFAFRQPTLDTWVDLEDGRVYTDIPTYVPLVAPRYRFRCLEPEQKRATVTFGALWRQVLALEAWAGHVATRLADMSWARYDDHRLIYDMLVQQAAMQHELQEMRGRVTALEQERSRRGQ